MHSSDIKSKLLDIGTNVKDGGKGIGRFSAFQIGKKLLIETIGFNPKTKKYSKVQIPLKSEIFNSTVGVDEIEIDTNEEELKGQNYKTYYKVEIDDFYDSTETEKDRKKKIIDKFLQDNIMDSIFERYPMKIFNKDVRFEINGEILNPSNYIIGNPEENKITYTDKKGTEHNIQFSFFQIKNFEKIKVFMTIENAGIQTIANGFEFEANWLSPKIGGWFIYIHSNTLNSDLYRNVDLDGLDEHVKHYKAFLKDQLNEFFTIKNQEFDNFTEKLKNDSYYPYREKQSSSQSKELLFNKLAYLVEDRYHILNEQNKLREIVYPLIDRTISNGELDNILKGVLKLSKKVITKFDNLLERTELENIIEFSDKVARKMEDVEFLEKLVYSEIAKHVKERKELHKYLEQMLWVFGEEYTNSTKLLSDKNLENNLLELRNDLLKYRPSKKEDNINEELKDKKIRSITDLFLYSEKIIDADKREVLIVELKAPKVKISPKELSQVMRYGREIDQKDVFSDRLKYKILLVSSGINKNAEFEIKGNQKSNSNSNPYFYFKNENENIEIWVIKWSDLFENLKRKLKYMSTMLETKDFDIREKAERDFEDIELGKTSSTLKKVAI